ncbi:MAG: hypothetical protein ACK50A_13825 [Sphingobacteriaceae bacterium]|jgi:hypothetical protein
MKNLFYLLLLVFITSCASKEKERAANSVAKMWDATTASVGSSATADTKTGTHKRLTLTLENIKGVNDAYPKKYVTSLSAYKFLEYLSPKEIEGYDGVTITLKGKDETFEKNYKISDLIEASTLLNIADSACRLIKNGTVEKIAPYLDPNSMPDSNIVQLSDVIKQIESKFGLTEKITIIGFEFGEIQDAKEPVMIVYSELSNAKSYTNYKFIMSRKMKKIMFIGINES